MMLKFKYQLFYNLIQFIVMLNLKSSRRLLSIFRFSTSNEKIETLSIKKNTVLNLK